MEDFLLPFLFLHQKTMKQYIIRTEEHFFNCACILDVFPVICLLAKCLPLVQRTITLAYCKNGRHCQTTWQLYTLCVPLYKKLWNANYQQKLSLFSNSVVLNSHNLFHISTFPELDDPYLKEGGFLKF